MSPEGAGPPEPVFAEALRVILPSPGQTLLLRGCLLPGEAGHRAWTAWRESVGDSSAAFEKDREGLKGLLPLVQAGLQRSHYGEDRRLLTYARAAWLREQLRGQAFRDICAEVLSALDAAGLPVITLGSAVMAETVYHDPSVRHCHAIDILVREEDLTAAAGEIRSLGFTRAGRRQESGPQHLSWRHETGLPLELRARLFQPGFGDPSADGLEARSRSQTIAGMPARILSPADNLLHICGRAVNTRARANLRWACDAWSIIDRHRDLDWQVLVDGAVECDLALPLFVQLRYLAKALDSPVPDEVSAGLAGAVQRNPEAGLEGVLSGALTGLRAAVGALAETNGGARLRIARFLVAPSPACMVRTWRIRHRALLPLYYLYRPLRYLAIRIRDRYLRPAAG